MAHYFCKGKGLEVGAMCYPYLFNSDCQLKYADIFENSELRRIFNEIPLEKLYSKDFSAFKNLKAHFAMTSHVLYKKIDSNFVATQSDKILNRIIRKKLKFKGIIISDDISMKALSGNFVLNARIALEAGCNLVLHCNGKINETTKLL